MHPNYRFEWLSPKYHIDISEDDRLQIHRSENMTKYWKISNYTYGWTEFDVMEPLNLAHTKVVSYSIWLCLILSKLLTTHFYTVLTYKFTKVRFLCPNRVLDDEKHNIWLCTQIQEYSTERFSTTIPLNSRDSSVNFTWSYQNYPDPKLLSSENNFAENRFLVEHGFLRVANISE